MCMCVYIYTYIYIYIYTHTYVCTHVRTYVHMCVHIKEQYSSTACMRLGKVIAKRAPIYENAGGSKQSSLFVG